MTVEEIYREKDIGHFERWSRTYEDSWLQRLLFERTHRAVLALAAGTVFEADKILDIGCGTGKLLRGVNAYWPAAQLIGVDPAQGMLKVARRLTPEATFYMAMAEALPLEDDSIDLAMSTTSFHHWRAQPIALREIVRVLHPGGCFILVDASFPEWLARAFRMKRFHSPARLRVLFAEAGLHVQLQQKIFRPWMATVGTKWEDEVD
jgi:ubiquinone/menaquinone biosynthesis C-methylase UbiE